MIPRTEKTSDHEKGKEQDTDQHASGALFCCFLQSAAVNLNRGTQTYKFIWKEHPGNKNFSSTVIRMIPRRHQTMKMGRNRTQINMPVEHSSAVSSSQQQRTLTEGNGHRLMNS
ncbi:uncharacterized protein LOC143291182 [Babylonia areolata]|uniref:uncharacterized protein LOC143291182 n=1 Tax=Babylonia areolata TaxID=304850 RepID=UPI003FD0B83D